MINKDGVTMRKPLFYILLATISTGCGEFTYKQGASIRDLDQAKQACKYASETNVEQCLEKNGWYVQKLNDIDLFATASESSNNASHIVKVDEKEVANETLHKEIATPLENTVTVSNTTNENKTNETKTVPKQTSINTSELTEQSKVKSNGAKPVKQEITTTDPMQTYKISSWWQFGTNDTRLRKDINQCTTKLGEAHAPDMAKQIYTRGFVVCMHELGWKALRAYQ